MNGQGYFWIGRTWFEVYWSAIALILVGRRLRALARAAPKRRYARAARGCRARFKAPPGTVGALARWPWLGDSAAGSSTTPTS